MAAYAYRGRRTGKDNIAAGSIKGVEFVIPGADVDVTDVSPYGNQVETGGFTNISAGNRAGIENTQSDGGKITSDGEPL